MDDHRVGLQERGEPATSSASMGWSSSVQPPASTASRSASAVRAVRPAGPTAVRSGTEEVSGGGAAGSSFSCTSRSSSAPPSALTRFSKALPRVRANCDCPKEEGAPSASASAALSTPAPSSSARRSQPGLAASAASARASSALGCGGGSPGTGTAGPRSSASRCRSAVPRVRGGGTSSAPGPWRVSRCRGIRSPAEVWHPPLTIGEPPPRAAATTGASRAADAVRSTTASRITGPASSRPTPITAAPATASSR